VNWLTALAVGLAATSTLCGFLWQRQRRIDAQLRQVAVALRHQQVVDDSQAALNASMARVIENLVRGHASDADDAPGEVVH
jgi:hypothetical protein